MSSSSRQAWPVVALLWPVAMLNYLDRQMLATMRLSMQADIVQLQSSETFGALMSIFLWVYAVCSPLGGIVADRVNRKWLIVGSLAVWSSVTLLMGNAHNLTTLMWLRGAMGISEALYIPAGLSLIADYHRGATRSLAVGIHMSGIYLGQALGGVGGWIAQSVSWRTAFASCGCVGVAYGAVLALLLREVEDRGPVTTSPEPRPDHDGTPVIWLGYAMLVVCFALPSVPGWAVKNWLPALLQERFHLDQTGSGLWATISHAGAAFLGVIVGGRCSDFLVTRQVFGRTWVSATGLFIQAVSIVGLGLAPGFGFAIACSVGFGFGFGIFDANSMPILCQLAPRRFRATGYGLMNLFGTGTGAVITKQLGRLKDNGTPFAISFAYCAIPSLIAAVVMLLIRPRDRDRGADAPPVTT